MVTNIKAVRAHRKERKTLYDRDCYRKQLFTEEGIVQLDWHIHLYSKV